MPVLWVHAPSMTVPEPLVLVGAEAHVCFRVGTSHSAFSGTDDRVPVQK